MKPTFRPHRKKRARKIGFRARKATRGGRKVIAARRRKGRKRLTSNRSTSRSIYFVTVGADSDSPDASREALSSVP